MQTWLNSHGHGQHEIIRNLTKDSVRNHRNVRAAGDDSRPPHTGGVGHDAGIQAQTSFQGYLHNVPGVQQASSLMSTFGMGSRSDERREATTTHSAADSYHAQSGNHAAPLVASGNASAFYDSGYGLPGDGAPSFPSAQYRSHLHHHSSSQGHDVHSFPGASPALPSANSSLPSESAGYNGTLGSYFSSPDSGPVYAHSYAPPQGPPPPTFPSVSFPAGHPYSEQPQYLPPSGYPPNQYSNDSPPPRSGGR